MPETIPMYSAFRGHRRVAAGSRREVALALHALAEIDPSLVLIFDDHDGRQLDLDLRGSAEQVSQRFPVPAEEGAAPRGRGRPRLGVVGREVTLLPRHWDWLQRQRGGPSATLRRLVDEARATHADRDRAREAQDAINRFISAVAGDLPGFEEANRALYGGDRARFEGEIARWPADVKTHLERWADAAFAPVDAGPRLGSTAGMPA
jgi:hypothetical protein